MDIILLLYFMGTSFMWTFVGSFVEFPDWLMIAGFIIHFAIFSGLSIWYRNYEATIKNLKAKIEKQEEDYTELKKDLDCVRLVVQKHIYI